MSHNKELFKRGETNDAAAEQGLFVLVKVRAGNELQRIASSGSLGAFLLLVRLAYDDAFVDLEVCVSTPLASAHVGVDVVP